MHGHVLLFICRPISVMLERATRATSQYIRFTAGKREYLLQPLLPHTPNSTIFQFSKESICVLSNFLFYFVISIDENNPIISYDANMGEAADGET